MPEAELLALDFAQDVIKNERHFVLTSQEKIAIRPKIDKLLELVEHSALQLCKTATSPVNPIKKTLDGFKDFAKGLHGGTAMSHMIGRMLMFTPPAAARGWEVTGRGRPRITNMPTCSNCTRFLRIHPAHGPGSGSVLLNLNSAIITQS